MAKTYYDKIAKGYDGLHKEEQLNKLRIIKNHIKLNKSTKLLDVGCGTGISSDFDCHVVGIDPSIELIKIARKKEKKKNKTKKSKKTFIKGKAEQLPFGRNEFDIVISITAIHNFTNIEKGLKEMKRVGKKKFIITILKKSKKLPKIKRLIKKHFNIKKKIQETKDIIYFLS